MAKQAVDEDSSLDYMELERELCIIKLQFLETKLIEAGRIKHRRVLSGSRYRALEERVGPHVLDEIFRR